MNELFDMGKYGPYVWGSFGCALAVFAWNVIAPMLSRRAALTRLRQAIESGEGE